MTSLNDIAASIQKGEREQARQALFDFLRGMPDNAQAWLYLAACAHTQAEAREALERVFQLEPTHPQARALAERYGWPVPVLGDGAQAQKRPAKRGRRVLRLLLIVLLLGFIVGALGAVAVFALRGGDETTGGGAEATPELTAAPTDEPTAEASPTRRPRPTTQPTAEATVEASPTRRPRPTAQPTP